MFAFQPIVEATTGETVWAEALIRWHHPKRDVRPSEFIPVAEALGLMPSYGAAYGVIAETALAWRAIRPDSVVTANSGPALEADWVRAIEALLDRGLIPDAMAFEVDWGALVRGQDHVRLLRTLGFRVGLDDYRTTMPLDELAELPIDFVKLDGSVVTPIVHDTDARTRMAAVVSACVERGRPVIAEYVSTREHASILVDAGCTLMQGGAYGWPLPHSAFLASTAERSEPLAPA